MVFCYFRNRAFRQPALLECMKERKRNFPLVLLESRKKGRKKGRKKDLGWAFQTNLQLLCYFWFGSKVGLREGCCVLFCIAISVFCKPFLLLVLCIFFSSFWEASLFFFAKLVPSHPLGFSFNFSDHLTKIRPPPLLCFSSVAAFCFLLYTQDSW